MDTLYLILLFIWSARSAACSRYVKLCCRYCVSFAQFDFMPLPPIGPVFPTRLLERISTRNTPQNPSLCPKRALRARLHRPPFLLASSFYLIFYFYHKHDICKRYNHSQNDYRITRRSHHEPRRFPLCIYTWGHLYSDRWISQMLYLCFITRLHSRNIPLLHLLKNDHTNWDEWDEKQSLIRDILQHVFSNIKEFIWDFIFARSKWSKYQTKLTISHGLSTTISSVNA